MWPELPFNTEELEFVIALISSDAIGEYFQEKSSIFETKKRILQSMGNLRIEPRHYFKLMMTYYQCDTAAYTAVAGGLKYLEFLFEYQGCERKCLMKMKVFSK
ncbi:MAG: hypothetical protein IPJ22_13430 [Bacteroidetes bacterium]|nr:hypothetical protein [Bacteroidota bacterium]